MPANYTYLVDTGVINADTAEVLTDVQNEFKQALGQTLNTAASTPQGTLIAAETLARTTVMKTNAEQANQINPNLAVGTFLDAVCAFLGIERGESKPTIGQGALFVGVSGTKILAGSRIQTDTGEMFTVSYDVTIQAGGSIRGTVASVNMGSVSLNKQDLTIIDGVIGWGKCTVDAATTVVLGTLQLGDPQLKNMRNQQLFKQGQGSIGAIQSALLSLDGVISCKVIDNNSGAAGLFNGVTFTLGNACWVCVYGSATKAQIASTIWDSCQGAIPFDFGTNSGVPVDSPNGTLVVDPASGESYRVKYTTPVLWDGWVELTVAVGTATADLSVAIANAIMKWAEGGVAGEVGLTVGQSLSAWEVASAVNREIPGVYIQHCGVAVVTPGGAKPTTFSENVPLKPFDLAILNVGRILVSLV